jgi:hypothetical protein
MVATNQNVSDFKIAELVQRFRGKRQFENRFSQLVCDFHPPFSFRPAVLFWSIRCIQLQCDGNEQADGDIT